MNTDRIYYWASIWWPDEHNSHGRALVSPNFGAERDMVRWITQRRTDDCQVSAYKRTIRGGQDYTDTPLIARDEPPADPARLKALLTDLSDMLERKKRELDRPGVKVKARQPGAANPIARPLTYHEVYDEEARRA